MGIDIHDEERRKALEKFYNMAMDGQYEGIMVKDLTAAYDIGGRSPSWIKVKPDYGGHTRDLDMIVVGAHFAHSGSNYRSQGISRFTCAVVDQDPKTGATTYHTACRVATGYSFEVTLPRALDGICIHSEAICVHVRLTTTQRLPVLIIVGAEEAAGACGAALGRQRHQVERSEVAVGAEGLEPGGSGQARVLHPAGAFVRPAGQGRRDHPVHRQGE